ncbi:indole-3-acetic acid inducible 2 [Striga asiatica]|uniref:Indole-3-acetic acid inducible 2 n=1 Tax=Striga asiatica TaxID=4170 RepID=A0A5A7R0C9_STRAF|nr:indole-3-acetic acid inducible 2 [Striga asiatica]
MNETDFLIHSNELGHCSLSQLTVWNQIGLPLREFLGGQNLSHNVFVQDLLLPLLRLDCSFLLFCGVEVNSGSVLSPNSRRVVPRPENIKQGIKPAIFRVVLHPNHLRVFRGARAHVLVRRVVHIALGVPDLGLGDTRHPLEGQFDTPEASRPELCESLTGRRRVSVGALCDRRGRRGSGGGGAASEA